MPGINAVLDSLYAARVRGDLDGTMRDIHDDGVFALNGQEVAGRARIEEAVKGLIAEWKWDDWQQITRTVDGNTIKVHWTAHVTNLKTGLSAKFDVADVVTFRDGKISEFRETADAGKMAAIAPPP